MRQLHLCLRGLRLCAPWRNPTGSLQTGVKKREKVEYEAEDRGNEVAIVKGCPPNVLSMVPSTPWATEKRTHFWRMGEPEGTESTQPYPSQAPITLSEVCQFLNHTQPAPKHTHLPIRFLYLTFASKQKTKNSRDWRKASSRKDKSKLKNKKRRETEALQWAEKNFEIYLIKLLRKLRHYINEMSMNREQQSS